MPRARPVLVPLLAGLLLALAGCVEVEERLAFEREGNGTYALTLRWNADVLGRVREAVGERAMTAFEGRALPLRADEWRETLRALDGLKVVMLEESVEDGGWKVLRLELAFQSLEDLRRWELFGRRTLEVTSRDDPRRGRLVMQPFTRLTLLDPLLELLAARRGGLPEGAPGDPGPLARLALEPPTVDLVERLLTPHLARVSLASTVAVAGQVVSAGERAASQEPRAARFAWTWADLVAGAARVVELDWTPGEFDRVPVAAWSGDAAVPGGG
jgi:hypothetical protein